LIRHVVEDLRRAPPPVQASNVRGFDGRYALENIEAVVARGHVIETESEPLTGTRFQRRYRSRPMRRS
jgi:hypothetical protein